MGVRSYARPRPARSTTNATAPRLEQQLAATIELATTPPKELPTVCPNCSAPLPPIFKGMKQVVCDYCGTIINI